MFEVHPKAVAEVLAEGFFVGQVGEGPDAMGLLVDSDLGANIALAFVVVEQIDQLAGKGVHEISADTMSPAGDGIEIHPVGRDFSMAGENGLSGLERSRAHLGLTGKGIIFPGAPPEEPPVQNGTEAEEVEVEVLVEGIEVFSIDNRLINSSTLSSVAVSSLSSI